ncbi:MAG: hypothetical protein K2X93_05635 [Candidatus Obscuribacterales bacterium]|nr:hypothetical protein [Candidatus Obscuribacterales bacterium]
MVTKPYAASANYINLTSSYCKSCDYDPKKAASAEACPFNTLYWNFLSRNRESFAADHRMQMMLRNLESRPAELMEEIYEGVSQVKEMIQNGRL